MSQNEEEEGEKDEDHTSHGDQCLVISRTREWTQRVPIGLGLCPWAARSQAQGRLQYILCEESFPEKIAQNLVQEARGLIDSNVALEQNNDSEDTSLWLRTTLLVCPNVPSWNESFHIFDDFVRFQERLWQDQDEGIDNSALSSNITLVAFHPEFVRWRGLPAGTQTGSIIMCRKPKENSNLPATLLELSTKAFGQRKVKVRFHDDERECYVDTKDCHALETTSSNMERPILPDNVMHRAPYPTIHLIQNHDLARLTLPNISRVKRKNMQQMASFDWDGVAKLLL